MTYLFYLLIAVLPLENHWLWRFELLGSFTLIKALGVLCLCGAFVSIVENSVSDVVFQSWPLRLFIVFVAIQCGSYFIHGGSAQVAPANYLNVLSIASLAVVTLALLTSIQRFNHVLLLSIGGAAFASLYTIRGQAGLSMAGFRPSGIFEDANYYALAMGLWIPLAYLLGVASRRKGIRIFCLGSLGVMLLGTTFAASRGGFIGLAAALLFMAWHSRRRARNLTIVLAITAPLFLFAPNSPVKRLLQPGYGDVEARDARLAAWQAGLRMIKAHPVTGVGLGNFKPLMAQYADPDVTFTSVAHNTYVETAAELGVPALIVHIGVFVSAFISFGRVRRRAAFVRFTYLSYAALGLQAGILGYGASAFFVSTWWQKIPWLFVFLAACLPPLAEAAISRRRQRANSDSTDLSSAGEPDRAYAS